MKWLVPAMSSLFIAAIVIMAITANSKTASLDRKYEYVEKALDEANVITEPAYWTVTGVDGDHLILVPSCKEAGKERIVRIGMDKSQLCQNSRKLALAKKQLVKGVKLRLIPHPDAGKMFRAYLEGARESVPCRNELLQGRFLE